MRNHGGRAGSGVEFTPAAVDEPFVVDDEIEVRRSDGVCLTGWETVIFELDDDPGYDGVFGSGSDS